MININKLIGKQLQNTPEYTVIDAEEFAPQKRTMRMFAQRINQETQKPEQKKYSVFLQFPYMQFYTVGHPEKPQYNHYYLSATEVPLEKADVLIQLPMPNVCEDGRLYAEHVQPPFVEFFWQSNFTEEWKAKYDEYFKINNLQLRPMIDGDFDHPYNDILPHWQNNKPKFSIQKKFFLEQLLRQ